MEPQRTSTGSSEKPWRTLDQARMRFERRYIIAVLYRANGCVKRAAALAGRDRSHFRELITRHGLEPKEYRRGRQRSRIARDASFRRRSWFGVPLD